MSDTMRFLLLKTFFSSFFGIIFESRFPQPLSLIDEKVC